MTVRGKFTGDEWEQVLEAPRWVVAAASAAQPDTAYRTGQERQQGFIAIAHGRELGNDLVSAVAEEYLADRRRLDLTFADRAAGMDATIERIGATVGLLTAKADAGDALAYGRWLADITDAVIAAASSGIGGPLVTAAEKAFRDRVRQAIRAALTQPPTSPQP